MRKHRYSAFLGTDLDLVLRSNRIETLILSGLGTGCVGSTGRDGFMLGYDIVILKDCTASVTREDDEAGLLPLTTRFGAIVVGCRDVLAAWETA